MPQQEYQLFSTLILNAFPLLVCLFITFFGRFFDDLLRIISIFFIVAVPIGAEVLRPWLAGQPLALSNLEPIDATALVWSLVAGYTVAYVPALPPSPPFLPSSLFPSSSSFERLEVD